MIPKRFVYFSEYRGVTGTPRGSNWPYWAIVERRRQTQEVAPPPWESELDKGEGARPPFPSPSLSFPPFPPPERKGVRIGLGVLVGLPPWGRALAGPLPSPSFIYGGRGHHKAHQLS